MVVEEVENVAKMVEKVALVAEKMSSEVVDELPKNGALKKTIMLVQRLSHKAAQEAHLAKQFIHKEFGSNDRDSELESFFYPYEVDNVRPVASLFESLMLYL
uniref:Uncharacterized protein n=1 Tax=Cannabis sativa TaxID=3483 RepID=A0A803PAF6_CANSA